MNGDWIGNVIARPLAACAVPAACALATVFVSADARAQAGHPLEIVAEATPDATASRRFILLSLSQEGATEDPLREQGLAYIRRGLTAADFVPVESVEEADIAVAFSFGIGASDFRPMRRPPVTRLPSTGFSPAGYTIVTNLDAYVDALAASPTGLVVINDIVSPSLRVINGVVQPDPSQAAPAPLTNGVRQRLSSGTPVFLELVAFDLQAYLETNHPVRLWRTVVYSIPSTTEVGSLLSAMLAGGQEYFGTQYDEMRYATVSESSRVARFIRGETQRHEPWVNDRRPGNPSSGR